LLLGRGRRRPGPGDPDGRTSGRRAVSNEGKFYQIKVRPVPAEAGGGLVYAVFQGRGIQDRAGSSRPGILIPVGNEYYLLGPGGGEPGNVPFRIIKSPGNIRIRVHREHEKQTAYKGFYIPYALNSAGDFGTG
jgi:hypothetical protein